MLFLCLLISLWQSAYHREPARDDFLHLKMFKGLSKYSTKIGFVLEGKSILFSHLNKMWQCGWWADQSLVIHIKRKVKKGKLHNLEAHIMELSNNWLLWTLLKIHFTINEAPFISDVFGIDWPLMSTIHICQGKSVSVCTKLGAFSIVLLWSVWLLFSNTGKKNSSIESQGGHKSYDNVYYLLYSHA